MPIAIANESTPVLVTNSSTSLGSVYIACSSATLTSSSTPAKRPNSASTVTLRGCAYSTTLRASAILSSNDKCEPSIITEVKPPSIHDLQRSKVSP